jgi:hypothetical protein
MCCTPLQPASDPPRLMALFQQVMATASPLANGTSADGPDLNSSDASTEPVPPHELNAWRRGFTPQAEIWNGRLAMLGLSVGFAILLISRLSIHGPG